MYVVKKRRHYTKYSNMRENDDSGVLNSNTLLTVKYYYSKLIYYITCTI